MLKEKITICQKYDCKLIKQTNLLYMGLGLVVDKNNLAGCFDNCPAGLGFVVVDIQVGRMGVVLGVVGGEDWVPGGWVGNLHLTTWVSFL